MYFTITTRSKACVIGARAWARPLVAVGGNFLENMCVLWLRVATDEREKFVGNFPVRHVICLGETCLLFKRDLCLGQTALFKFVVCHWPVIGRRAVAHAAALSPRFSIR